MTLFVCCCNCWLGTKLLPVLHLALQSSALPTEPQQDQPPTLKQLHVHLHVELKHKLFRGGGAKE